MAVAALNNKEFHGKRLRVEVSDCLDFLKYKFIVQTAFNKYSTTSTWSTGTC
jgi:RNA recognition motif-containing protein